jgi:hypothetical protein
MCTLPINHPSPTRCNLCAYSRNT